jgi:hypothetical protein
MTTCTHAVHDDWVDEGGDEEGVAEVGVEVEALQQARVDAWCERTIHSSME